MHSNIEVELCYRIANGSDTYIHIYIYFIYIYIYTNTHKLHLLTIEV